VQSLNINVVTIALETLSFYDDLQLRACHLVLSVSINLSYKLALFSC